MDVTMQNVYIEKSSQNDSVESNIFQAFTCSLYYFCIMPTVTRNTSFSYNKKLTKLPHTVEEII